MKRILVLAFIGTVALTLSASAAPNNKKAARSASRATVAHSVTPRGGGHAFRQAAPVRTSRAFTAARMHSLTLRARAGTSKAELQQVSDAAVKLLGR